MAFIIPFLACFGGWNYLTQNDFYFFLYSVGGISDKLGVTRELRGSKSTRAGVSPHLTGQDVTKVKAKFGSNLNTQQILQ